MRWISVKERFPEQGQSVIYYFDKCGVYAGKYEKYKWPEEAGGHESDCFYSDDGYLCDDVTHWMPLPEPPILLSE